MLGDSPEFGMFIEKIRLLEMPLLGRRFMLYHANGVSMSKIDEIHLSPR